MVISYNKLWELLTNKKMSKTDLRKTIGVLTNTIKKTNKYEEQIKP